MVHVPNGVDVEAFRPDAAARASVRAELGADPGARLVGLFARSSPEKDLPTFAAAARALAAREPSARFVLAGPGLDPSHAGLVALLGDAAARASLLGARDDVARLMAAMDLVTLSSVGEALPLSIAEAMACGVPCVVTDVGDCAELVGPTGEVVPPSDPRALAAAWERLLRLDDAARARRGEAARARIVERYSLDASAARLAALYRAMTA